MTDIKIAVEKLIRSAVTGEKLVLPENLDMEMLYKQLKRHSIVAMGYTGLVNCGADKKHPVMQKLFRDYINVMMKSEKQLAAVDMLFAAFEEKGIDYLPLKGINMKKLYPKPEMRAMGDADILIRKEQYSEIEKIVEAMGFENAVSADHTINWKKEELYLELHVNLVPEEDEDYLEYLTDGWSRALKKEKHQYCFSKEDEFIFIFVHFARHFRFGGIGYRQLTDLWIYTRERKDLDYSLIEKEMEMLGVSEFYKNVMQTVKVCFEDAKENEATSIISEFVFNSGNWGNMVSVSIAHNVKELKKDQVKAKSVKFHNFIEAMFPVNEYFVRANPMLENHPYLFPIFWVKRWFDVLFNRRERIKKRFKLVASVDNEDVTFRKTMLEKIGLDFNF